MHVSWIWEVPIVFLKVCVMCSFEKVMPPWIVKLAFSHKNTRRPKDIMEFGYLHGSSNIESEFS